MNNLEQFQAYADAFEETYIDNNWQRLEQYFAADAVYAPGDGSEIVGRENILAHLQTSIDGLDRRFDSRTLKATPPTAEGNTVSLSWALHLSKAPAPDLVAAGVEHATYANGVITRLEDIFDPGTPESLGAWMETHGQLLAG